MNMDKDKMAERIFHLTLEILFRLTGEDYTVVRQTSSEPCQDPVSEGWGRSLSPIMGPPPHLLIYENLNDQKILGLAYKMIELLTGEVPIRCQDVSIYFSLEEWEYLEGHKDLYKDVIMEVPRPLTSPVLSSKWTTPERCHRPLLLQDCKQEDPNVPQDHQFHTTLHSLSGDLRYRRIFFIEPSRMNMDRDKMAERILHLTLEILFQLTGEDYTVVRQTSSERCQDPVSEGWGRPLSPIMMPPSHLLIYENLNDQKILGLAHKMIELLTGEVPIRCQDVNIYFSLEEWKYLEGHKDLYKDVIMEVPRPLTSLVLSSKWTTPERCHRPLLLQYCKQEDPNVPQDHQGEDLPHINTTETYVRGDERCKEEISTFNCTGDCTRSSEGHVIFSDFAADNHSSTSVTCEERVIFPDTPQAHLRKNLNPDPYQQVLSSASSKTNMQNESQRTAVKNEITYIEEKPFSCSKCGKYYSRKSSLVTHQRTHTGEKTFSCSECGKCFNRKTNLVAHLRIHTGEKPFSCSECGKRCSQRSKLKIHQRIHTGEKPFSCLECGKCFTYKSDLDRHQKIHSRQKSFSCSECGENYSEKCLLLDHQIIHTGEKPFSCSECGKCFKYKLSFDKHQRIHTGEKSFSCPECGENYSKKCLLVKHQRIHTGEKPFSCSECGKNYSEKCLLVKHQRIHTGEKPFSCSECGKCFRLKGQLVLHQRSHTGEKPFSCSECGKYFTRKTNLIAHLRTHTGEKPFSCSECGKRCSERAKLEIHQRIHTGEKPFSCSECGKCFIDKSDLGRHHKIHSRQKSFSCSECGKRFKYKLNFDKHQRIHKQ
ncbi:zinc finger protein 813-like [Ranitomeya imitator]|uniref:zinc finger protein 813-like n=1 Tax=Ranitomeya imitator TaxID=111125 RepID=UPI0037E95D7D